MNYDLMQKYVRVSCGKRSPEMDEILKESLLRCRMPTKQVNDCDGKVLKLLTMIKQPKRLLEVGTLFGYSTIYMAEGCDSCSVVSLEVNDEFAEVARRNLEKAGLSDRVEVIVGDALQILRDYSGEAFDFVFVDGKKEDYPAYLKLIYPLLADEGVLVADDTFAFGYITEQSVEDENLQRAVDGVKTYNRAVLGATNLFSTILTTDQGMTVSVKNRAS